MFDPEEVELSETGEQACHLCGQEINDSKWKMEAGPVCESCASDGIEL